MHIPDSFWLYMHGGMTSVFFCSLPIAHNAVIRQEEKQINPLLTDIIQETPLGNLQCRKHASPQFHPVHMLSRQISIDPISTLICTLSLCPAPLFKDADQDDIHTAKRLMPSMQEHRITWETL